MVELGGWDNPQGQIVALRGGAGLCNLRSQNVEVVILNQGEDTTFEEDLAKDVLE